MIVARDTLSVLPTKEKYGQFGQDRFLADPSVLLLAPPVGEDPPTAALGEDWSEEDLELEEELVDERG